MERNTGVLYEKIGKGRADKSGSKATCDEFLLLQKCSGITNRPQIM